MPDSQWMEEAHNVMLGHTFMFVCLAGTLIDKGVVGRDEMIERLQGMADFVASAGAGGATEPIEAAADFLSEFRESFSNVKEATEITTSIETIRTVLARRKRDGRHGGEPGDGG